MKKSISIVVLLALVAAGAFAQMSIGGGALFDMSFNNGNKWDFAGSKGTIAYKNMSYGVFFFFDAQYVEVAVSYAFGSFSDDLKGDGKLADSAGLFNDLKATQFGISLLGKYPIDMGGFTLFPLIGLDYNMVSSLKDKSTSYTNAGDFSQLGILAGIGADFDLSGSLYLRAEGLFHLRLPSKYTKEGVEAPLETTFGMGPLIKVAAGFRF